MSSAKYGKIKAVKDFEPKFRLLSELQRLGERAFINKLKKRNPDITDGEVAIEIDRWYLQRPEGSDEGFTSRVDISAVISK